MSIHRALLLLAMLGVGVALVAGCGSSKSSSSSNDSGSNLGQGIVATVGDTNITQAQLDAVMKGAEARTKSSGGTFPATGSPAYTQTQDKALELLVQQLELEQKAKELGTTITDQQVDARLQQIIQQPPPNGFGGNKTRYRAQLKAVGFTEKQVRDYIVRPLLVSEAVNADATKDVSSAVSVSDDQVKAYYDQHTQNYSTPQTRVVRHILVKSKSLADRLYKQVEAGANFAALAKKYSQDPGTRGLGGELTITRGQTVKPFDTAAFSLRTGQISKPVRSQYGWHIIRAEKPAVPRQVTPFTKVKASIRQLLLQQEKAKVEAKKTQAVAKFVAAMQKEYCSGKLKFAKGFVPNPDPCAATK